MEGIYDTQDMANMQKPNDSPLFTKLPPELRLQIYNEVFEGSRTSYKQSHVIGNRTYRNMLWPTDHCNFLLTCRQAYNEALETYWSKTMLYGDREDDEILFFLQSVVPSFAKLHIKHIRGLRATHLNQRPVHGCLDEFQSLQAIGFQYGFIYNMTGWDNPPTIQEQIDDDFEAHRRDFNKLIYDGGPAVICRIFFRRGVFEGGWLVEGQSKEDRKVCFYNFSTGKVIYADDLDQIDDEEAYFAMVLDNQAPAEEARQEL